MNKHIYLSPPYLGDAERKFVEEAFDLNWIAPIGPHLSAFEDEQCRRASRKFGVALSSGTAAIHLALRWFGVTNGDYVFCSDLTFAGSCNPIMYQGAIPVFIDSEPDTWNMSPQALVKAFEWVSRQRKMPKAVIIVDLYGVSANWDKLIPICNEYGVPVIEDAAEAVGSMYKERPCGSFGDISIFSYNGNKIVTTSGGGMLVTDDKGTADKIRFWATQAREPEIHYEHKEIGYNYRLSNISAAIGLGQLSILAEKISRRKAIYEFYDSAFTGYPIRLQDIPDGYTTNYWLSVAILDKDSPVRPDYIVKRLAEHCIESRPAWKPMHLQPVFKDALFFTHDDAESENIFYNGICLPSGEALDGDDLNIIVRTVLASLEVTPSW